MKILFMLYPSSSGTFGCFAYMLAIAHEARQRGHEVILDACPPSSLLLTQNGFPVVGFGGAAAVTAPCAVNDIHHVFELIGLDDPAYWQRLMEHELSLIQEIRPDAAVVDMRPMATVSARRCGVPLVAMAPSEPIPGPPRGATGIHSLTSPDGCRSITSTRPS